MNESTHRQMSMWMTVDHQVTLAGFAQVVLLSGRERVTFLPEAEFQVQPAWDALRGLPPLASKVPSVNRENHSPEGQRGVSWATSILRAVGRTPRPGRRGGAALGSW